MRPQAFNRVISVGFSKPLPTNASEKEIRKDLQFLGSDIWNLAMERSESIIPLWFKAMRKRRSRPMLIDPAGNHVNGYDMIRLCHHFGKSIKSVAKSEKNIGFMLPTSRDAALGIISILGTGKTSVNLNYSSPVDTILGCIEKAEVSTVVTTHAFLDKLCNKNGEFVHIAEKCKIVYLDDEEKKLTTLGKLVSAFIIRTCPKSILRPLWFTSAKLSDDAVILFSSGSEGTPKGVELTHKNVISNALQGDNVIKLRRTDVMTALLPLFHSFGFTLTFILPLLDGVPMVLCPDPTDIKTLARVCAQYKTTILMGTPTFLRAIAINRWVHPMCLDTLRYIIAGAEKLRPEMREAFKLKFGKDIYEGYGCTELTPLATINAPNVLLDDFLTMEKCSVDINTLMDSIVIVRKDLVFDQCDFSIEAGASAMHALNHNRLCFTGCTGNIAGEYGICYGEASFDGTDLQIHGENAALMCTSKNPVTDNAGIILKSVEEASGLPVNSCIWDGTLFYTFGEDPQFDGSNWTDTAKEVYLRLKPD